MRAWLAYAVAALAPLVVGGALWALSSPDGASRTASAIDKRLRAHDAKVVVLGSSIALRDVDRDLLASALGLAADEVIKVTVPASTGAHWYALLKHHVAQATERGSVVVIADALASLLTTDVDGHDSRMRLADLVPGEDPVLARTFSDGGSLGDERRRLELRELRRAWVSRPGDALIGLLRSGAVANGRQLVLDVTDRVFATDQLERSRSGGLPEMFRAPDPEHAWHIPASPKQSYLPDMMDVCERAGCRILFVRMPFPPSFPEADRLPPQVEHDLAAWLAGERTASYAELRTLGLDDTSFSDREHATPEGAVRLTRAVAALIQDRGLFGPSPQPGWVPPLGAVTVSGEAVDPVQGVDLRAGQTLRVEVAEPWPAGEAVTLRVVVTAEDGAAAQLVWGDQRVDLRGAGRIVGEVAGPSPTGPTAVSLTVTQGTLHVASASLGRPLAMAWLVGDDVAARAAAVRLVGGRRSDHGVVPVFSGPPQVPDAGGLRVQRGPHGVGRLVVPTLEPLADAKSDSSVLDRVEEGAQLGTDYLIDACSPLIVLEDGAPLAWPHAFCDQVPTLRGGRMCHVGGAVTLSASDGSDPLENGRRYTLGLDPARLCAVKAKPGASPLYDAVWLYPGDELTLRAEDGADRLPWGARTLDLAAELQLGPPDALELQVGGATVALTADALAAGMRYEAPAPVDGDEPVVIRNRGGGWWLLTRAVLGER